MPRPAYQIGAANRFGEYANCRRRSTARAATFPVSVISREELAP